MSDTTLDSAIAAAREACYTEDDFTEADEIAAAGLDILDGR